MSFFILLNTEDDVLKNASNQTAGGNIWGGDTMEVNGYH